MKKVRLMLLYLLTISLTCITQSSSHHFKKQAVLGISYTEQGTVTVSPVEYIKAYTEKVQVPETTKITEPGKIIVIDAGLLSSEEFRQNAAVGLSSGIMESSKKTSK